MLVNADSRRIPLRDGSAHCIVTSPPYWGLRDYQVDGQIGLEQTPEAYVENMVAMMREVWRVLRDDGTCWINLGDSYNGSGGAGGDYGEGGLREGQPVYPGRRVGQCGHNAIVGSTQKNVQGRTPIYKGLKPKDLLGIPWMVAFALRADGWYLRSDIVWAKPNPMPESVTDRPTKSHEYIFLLSKSPKYYYDCDAIREPQTGNAHARGYGDSPKGRTAEPMNRANSSFHISTSVSTVVPGGRNRRTVWTVATEPYAGAHYATFPTALIVPCVLAGTSQRGVCSKCGAPWVLETNSHIEYSQKIHNGTKYHGKGQFQNQAANRHRDGHIPGTKISETSGWHPSCACDAGEPIPAIVLDPFCGSGTTGEVCRNTGRRFVGLDISLQYLTEQALPRAERKTAPSAVAKLPMFAEM